MPLTQKKYPDWVQKFRTRGTTVKKIGDSYYLYKRTSRRVKGKKYPQPVDTYIGLITPDGVISSHKKKVSITNTEVWEYGFSKVVWELCPDDWKKPLGDDWEDVLAIILLKKSPTSYIQRNRSSLSLRLYQQYGYNFDGLEPLKTIYLVCLDKTEIISKVDEKQQSLLDQLQVELGLC